MPFKGGKIGSGGKRPGAGRPKKAELDAKAKALEVWEEQIRKQEQKLAERYVKRAMKSDRVLLDLRKTRLPDASQKIEVQGELTIDDLLIKVAERTRAERKRGQGTKGDT